MKDKTQLNAFISYAHEDRIYFDLLLDGLKRHSKYMPIGWKIWEDTQIPVSVNWHDFIQNEVETCDFAILLISSNFLYSKYIKQHELGKFLKRERVDTFFVFPILIDPCNYQKYPQLSKIQFFSAKGEDYGKPNIKDLTYADLVMLSEDGKILPNPNRERYHMNLVEEIERALKYLQKK
jgi:hypothetical protein